MTRFENEEISFEVPEDWHDDSRTMFVLPEVQTNISLTNRDADPRIPIGEYAAALVRQMAAHWPQLEVLEGREVRVGDEPGAHVEVEWKGPDGRLRSVARIVLREQKLWSFTATTPVDKLDETRATIDRAMRSFETLK